MEHQGKPSGRSSDAKSDFAREARIVVEATDLDPDVREFAERQIFGPSSKVGPASGAPRSLDRMIAALHDSDINVGMQSFCWCGFRVWIGDTLNGIKAEALVDSRDQAWMTDGSIAQWLHECAIRLYPDSAYASAHTVRPA